MRDMSYAFDLCLNINDMSASFDLSISALVMSLDIFVSQVVMPIVVNQPMSFRFTLLFRAMKSCN